MNTTLQKRIARAVLGAVCALPFGAQAALGGNVASIGTDAAQMQAAAGSAISQSAYTVYPLTLPSGTVVREFVAANGNVFGVAWAGPTLPDLRTTLGASFDTYLASTATRRATPLAVSSDTLVVFSGGQLRAFSGYAYLPQAVPAGVNVNVIQ